jgi:hypothetical protein
MFDLYISKADPSERLATRPGAGLPAHVSPRQWQLMLKVPLEEHIGLIVNEDIQEDIAACGFSYFAMG